VVAVVCTRMAAPRPRWGLWRLAGEHRGGCRVLKAVSVGLSLALPSVRSTTAMGVQGCPVFARRACTTEGRSTQAMRENSARRRLWFQY